MPELHDICTSKADYQIIRKIAKRAQSEIDDERELLDIEMDLTAAHGTNPLDLKKLLKADKFNLAHDIYGIKRHLNRKNCQLEDCFSPRTSL